MSRMTAKEWRDWKLYRRVCGPIGYERQDYNTAMIVCAIRQLNDTLIAVNGGQPGEPVSVNDCLLKFGEVKNKTLEDVITESVDAAQNAVQRLKK